MEMTLGKLESAIIEIAENLANDAGMSGSHSDGGASSLINNLKLFKKGLSYSRDYCEGMMLTVPTEFVIYLKHYDPEWKEYQRLVKKFES